MNPFARRTYGTLERVTERVYLFRNIVNSVIILGDEASAVIDTQVNVSMAERLVQPAVLLHRAGELQGAADGHQHALGRERLLEELERPELGGAHRVGEVCLAAHHDDRHVGRAALELLQRREPVGAGGHHQVEEHGVGRRLLDGGERGGAVGRLRRLEPLGL